GSRRHARSIGLTVPSDSASTLQLAVRPKFFGSRAPTVVRMTAAPSLIPELEEFVQHGSPTRRAKTLKRITSLFLDGAPDFNEEHLSLFDDVFNRLIDEIETKARAELSRRLAPV